MMKMITNKKKLIIDCDVEYPVDKFTPETVAAVMRDYMSLNRFVVGIPEISLYSENVKVIQNPIEVITDDSNSLPSNRTTH